jgi:Tfp pilus assembly protein PilF
MSKSMVVTLPVIMILLDYWPLGRFKSKKGSLLLWQLREKTPFFVLAAVLTIITLYTMYSPTIKYFPLGSRFANAPVSFVTYLEKTFWPHDLAVFYPFSNQLPVWQVMGSVLLILVISVAVIAMMKRMPYLFVGWLWYAITLLPVIGIIQNGYYAMADRYTYLPSIGIAVMLAWGIPFMFSSEDMRKKILFPAGIAALAILAVLAWQQCSFWKNSITLFSHALQVTKDNYLAHNNFANALVNEGKIVEAIDHFNKAIIIKPDYADAYSNRGVAYHKLGQYQRAIEDYNQNIRLNPNYARAYNNRGISYNKLGQYQLAIDDFNKAISLIPNYTRAYNKRSNAYFNQGNKERGCRDLQKACELGECKLLEWTKGNGYCR